MSSSSKKTNRSINSKKSSVRLNNNNHNSIINLYSSSSNSTHNTDHQAVPSSPTKKFKTSHLPDLHNPNTKAILTSIKTRNSSQDDRASSSRKSKPQSSTKKSSRSSFRSSLLSFIIKTSICYLTLSYVYFCPRDPTQTPFVCRNLAQLHWKLEPHLSPYLAPINLHVRQPIQSTIDRNLLPFYHNYLLPTYAKLSPHLIQLFDLSKRSILNSGLIDQAQKAQALYLDPIIQHVQHRYQSKLKPHLQLLVSQANHALTIVRKSRLIRFLKTYLPHLKRWAHDYIIQPFQRTVIPHLNQLYQQHIRPAIVRAYLAAYQYLVIDENFIKLNLRNFRKSYRIRLLRPLKRLHDIYVSPQITKIALKLNEYQTRYQNDSIRILRHTAPPNDPAHQSESPFEHFPEKAVTEEESLQRVQDDDQPPEASSGMADDKKPLDGNIAVQQSPPIVHSSPSAPVDDKASEPEENHMTDEQLEKESKLNVNETSSDFQPEELLTKRETTRDALPLDDDEQYHHNFSREDDWQQQEDLAPIAQSIETDSLTVDADEFMDEINNEIASEVSSASPSEVPEPAETTEHLSKRKAEETAAKRKRLEKLAADGLTRMTSLEKEQMEVFIKKLVKKRDPENLKAYSEFLKKERVKKIERESSKLLEKLEKWFQRNAAVESSNLEDKIAEAERVVKKSKDKFLDKLIRPHLAEITQFGQREYQKEDEIVRDCWSPIEAYYLEVQAELGPGLTWLDDVTHRDWTVYHQFRSLAEAAKATMEGIINGVESEYLGQIPQPDFFENLGQAKAAVEDLHTRFEGALDRVYRAHIAQLGSHGDPHQNLDSDSTPNNKPAQEPAPQTAAEHRDEL